MQIRDHADEAVGQQAFTKQLVYLDSLSIQGLRCLERVELSLDSKRNVFIGDNGAGKTSLLEAIYLLGRGHSFRTANSRRLIQDERDQCVVRAQVQNAHGRLPVGILKTADATRVKLGQDTSGSFFARLWSRPTGSTCVIDATPGLEERALVNAIVTIIVAINIIFAAS